MKKTPTIEPSQLIEFLRQELNELPDQRTGKNIKYQIAEATMAAFSVFFTQLPSFLEHQRLMKQQKGKDNASSLFGFEEIPCDNQIRTLLDPVLAKIVFPTFKTLWKWLDENQQLHQFQYLENQILVAFDGKEYYSGATLLQ
ncbi:MAG: hypothetical protein AB4038_22295 [Prochloraceae cyanobacterium]